MRTTLALVVLVACVLISVSDAKRLSLKDNHRQLIDQLTDDRRHGAVPTAGVDSRDTKDAVADKTSTGGSDTKTKNNDEDDVNPTYKHYGGTGSNSDSSTDTHRYYSVDDRTGSSSNDDGHKPKH